MSEGAVSGFEPFINGDSRILILGSFPSVKSREVSFYYGNPQNKFWGILAYSANAPLPINLQQKKRLLLDCKVALWDIVTSCEIKGSMDKDIVSPVIADIPALLQKYPVQKIITNGKTAYKLLKRAYPDIATACLALPSTSPANARLDKNIWIAALRELFEHL